MISDLVSFVFDQKLETDDRVPLLSWDLGGDTWGLYPPSIYYWTQALVLFPTCAIFSMIMATITYYTIIPRKRSMIAYMIGFGIVIPLCTWYFPFHLLDYFDVRNKVLRFCVAAVYPILTMFRTSEAMFGYSPHSVEKTYTNYMIYYCAAIEIQFDPQTNRPIRSSFKDSVNAIKNFLMCACILGSYKSIFCSNLCEPFQSSANGNDPHYNLMDIFDLNLLRNNFVAAMLLQLYLSTYISALSVLVTGILGVKIQQGMMDNPLMKATSPSNFWAGRWNVVIHGGLKRGVFKPVYSISSTKFIAVTAAFLASGLFHEYILVVIHAPHLNFKSAVGKQTAFMMWNAGLIILENLIGKAKIFSWIQKHLPKAVVTFLVICTAMPVAHWFLHPYTKSGMFLQGDIAMPMIKKII